MTFDYDSHYDPPAPVMSITVRRPGDDTRQVTTDALVDTGADITCLPEVLINAVGGESASTYNVYGINRISLGSVRSYFLQFEIGTNKKFAEAIAMGDQMILGRNLINEFTLELNGPALKLNIK